MNNYALLVLAESVATEHGEIDWFTKYYLRYREKYGIHCSIELAIEAVGLWPQFEAAAESAGAFEV